MNRTEAFQVLGLEDAPGAPPDAMAVRVAFAKAILAAHPDTATVITGLGDVTKIKAAREYLLSLVEGEKNTCLLCKGRGYIHGTRCIACN